MSVLMVKSSEFVWDHHLPCINM